MKFAFNERLTCRSQFFTVMLNLFQHLFRSRNKFGMTTLFLNLSSSFRKITAYVLIFSLLWQNCLWAGSLQILEEELGPVRVRTYGGRKIGLVEPGTIRDKAIHNVFEDLQLLEEGGLVFKGAPDTTKIYNRIYNADPIQLSGAIVADYPLPMVFANPGGLVLENPDFHNIHDLTLAAGSLAQTNEGMAYGVKDGSVTINKTVVQEDNDLKTLSLAGRKIHINQSFLSPSESLVLRAGEHVKGWKGEEEWVSEDDAPKGPSSSQDSIILDANTILRSKGLFLESVDEGTAIHARGLLQSTEGDIIIQAKGNVYLDKFFAHQNLNIETTGKVFLGKQAFVGGAVNIKASEIINQGKLIGTGNITFRGECRNEGFIQTQGIFDAPNLVNMAQGQLEAKSVANPLGLFSRNLGTIEIQDDLKLTATAETLKGIIKTQGAVEVGGQELTINGNLYAQNGVDFKDLKKLKNKQNSSLSAFGNGFQGKLGVLENEGKIDLSLENAWIGTSTNQKTGVIRTRGHSVLTGNHHYNYGTVFTCGIHQTTLTGTYKDDGIVYAPTAVLLDAQEVLYTNSHKSFLKDGVIRARSRLNAGSNVSFELNGNTNLCFLQMSSQQNLGYNGKIQQLSSQATRFPLLDYFTIFNQTPVDPETFKKEIEAMALNSWIKTRPPFASAITLQAGGNMNYEGATISQTSGSVNLFAKNKICTKTSKIQAGYFNGDSTAITCKTAVLNDTKLTSLFGNTSIMAQKSATLNHCDIRGGLSANVSSQSITMNGSTIKSTHGPVTVQGTQSATLTHSTLKGQETEMNGGERLILSQSHIEGLYNSFKANHIEANANTINGSAAFVATQDLKIHDLQASSAVTALAPTSTLSGTNTAESLQVQSKVINQLGTIRTDKDTHLEATEAYVDTPTSRNEAGSNLTLIAPKTIGFTGYQKAGDTLEVVLKDMDLLDFLNQSEARLTKAHLLEGEVTFDKDFTLNRTLHLWAQSLKNKAKFTATNDFIAHMQTLIMNEGSMVAQGDMTLTSEGLTANFGLLEAANLNVKGKTVVHESSVERHAISGGYQDVLKSGAIMRARTGNLNVEATELLQARGSKFEAKLNIDLKSAGKLYLGAQQLASEATHSDEESYYHRYSLSNHKAQVNAGANVNIWSGEGMIFEGLDVRAAGYIRAKSEGTLENRTVHNIVQETSRTESEGDFFEGKTTETTQTSANTVVRNTYKAGEDVRFESEGDNLQQAPHIESGGSTTIQSNKGKVSIKADKSSFMTSTQKSSKSVVWQSQQQKGRYDETVEMLEILAKGGIHISGAQGVEVEIRQDQNLAHSLNALAARAETSWVKELRKDPKVTWRLIAEEHKEWDKKVQGLTGPAAAVIALAIAIATQGTGASLVSGLTANATIGAMSSAGFTSLVTQASISLINNQGDISKVLKDLGSQENLKSLATSVASAGMVQGFSGHLGLPEQAKGFVQHLQKNVVSSGTSAGLGILINRQDVRDALLQAAKGIAVNTIAGWGANQIKEARTPGAIGSLIHKVEHGLLGAGMGALLSKDPLSGAMGAMIAEIVAEASLDVLGSQKAAGFGRLSAASAALFSGQDVDTALATATNAVENNFLFKPLEEALEDALDPTRKKTLEEEMFETILEAVQEEAEEQRKKPQGLKAMKKTPNAFWDMYVRDWKEGLKHYGKLDYLNILSYAPVPFVGSSAALACEGREIYRGKQTVGGAVFDMGVGIVVGKTLMWTTKGIISGAQYLGRQGMQLFNRVNTRIRQILTPAPQNMGNSLTSNVNQEVPSNSYSSFLTIEDFGPNAGRIKEVRGTVTLENREHLSVFVDFFSGEGLKPRNIMANLIRNAEDRGVKSLTVQGHIANPKLKKYLTNHYGLVRGEEISHFSSFTIPIRSWKKLRREIYEEDLGKNIGGVEWFMAELSMKSRDVANIFVERIEGKGIKPRNIMDNLVNIAKETGAKVLEIESQITNTKLKNHLIKRYKLVPGELDWTNTDNLLIESTHKNRMWDKITILLQPGAPQDLAQQLSNKLGVVSRNNVGTIRGNKIGKDIVLYGAVIGGTVGFAGLVGQYIRSRPGYESFPFGWLSPEEKPITNIRLNSKGYLVAGYEKSETTKEPESHEAPSYEQPNLKENAITDADASSTMTLEERRTAAFVDNYLEDIERRHKNQKGSAENNH